MQLVRLTVERFGGIERAEVELGAGLNILYGPNDLGKSSLAEAIRLALLLPPSSSASAPFVSWTAAEPPIVKLVYRTAPDELFRVTKKFDPERGGSALLERSRDGIDFDTVARSREVDERIRQHLCWGIPAPGKGAPKGMPVSFLATALIAKQGEVDAILASTLANDPDESGRLRISKALQALAQDPLFKKVILKTQERVEEAFKQDGKPRAGKGSPFTQMADLVREAQQQLEDRRKDVDEAEGIRKKVQELTQRRSELESRRDECKRTLARAEREERLRKALGELAKIDALISTVKQLENEEQKRTVELEKLAGAVRTHEEMLKEEDAALAKARDLQKELRSEARAQARAIRKAELDKKALEVSAQQRDAVEKKTKAEAVRDLARRTEAAQKQKKGHEEELKKSQRTLETKRAGLEELRGVALYRSWKAAAGMLEKAQSSAKQAESYQTTAAAKREEAKAILAELQGKTVPAADVVTRIKTIDRDLQIAEGKIKVGLTVEIEPDKALEIEHASDGKAATRVKLTELTALTAEREVELRIPGVARITAGGGAKKAREEAKKLRASWKAQGQPVLDAAGVASITDLEAAHA
jgi:DNA repair exonuclease SbcCD ATPase subunit